MKHLRRTLRLARIAIHLLHGLLLTGLFGRARAGDVSARYERIVRWWNQRLCRILGLRVEMRGIPTESPTLFVANHVSWLDIPVLRGLTPAHLVSKLEVRRWPVIGWLAAAAGTLFIQRGERHAASQTIEQITWYLRRGRSIIVFAEGTTGNGQELKRFRPRLFAAASLAKRSIQPVAIHYPLANGQPNPIVPFVGSDSLLPHLLRLLVEPHITVIVTFCPVIPSEGCDRRDLAARTQQAVAEVIGFADEPVTRSQHQHGM